MTWKEEDGGHVFGDYTVKPKVEPGTGDIKYELYLWQRISIQPGELIANKFETLDAAKSAAEKHQGLQNELHKAWIKAVTDLGGRPV